MYRPYQRILRIACAATLLVVTIAEDARSQSTGPVGPQPTGSTSSTAVSIYPDIPQFGGPNSVGGFLKEDNEPVDEYRCQRLQDHFQPWFDFKGRVNEKTGLQFGFNNTILYHLASTSPGEREAASHIQQIVGQWELCNRGDPNAGLLVYETFYRDRVGSDLTPFDLGFEAGSIVPTALTYNEFSFTVSQLFWKQYAFDRDFAIAVGRIDPGAFVDVYALASPTLHFTNFAFSVSPTVPFPDPGLGLTLGAMLTQHVYATGGFCDANGKITRSGFDTFFDDAEYFSWVEVGVTSERDRIYMDNTHVTLWHVDPRKAAGVPEGWGVLFSTSRFINDTWLPFLRCGYSDGDTALLQANVSTGLGYRGKNKDVAGVGVSWGKPSDGTLRDQFTSELFYRIQFTQFLAITPSVQLIGDPALNPNKDLLAFFGLRLRTSF